MSMCVCACVALPTYFSLHSSQLEQLQAQGPPKPVATTPIKATPELIPNPAYVTWKDKLIALTAKMQTHAKKEEFVEAMNASKAVCAPM